MGAQTATEDGSAATNRVLQLDGNGSFVELPPGAFTNLDEVTVEGWVKWESFGEWSRFFDFTLAGYSLCVMNSWTSSTLWVGLHRIDDWPELRLPGIISLGRWTHVAAAFGTNGLGVFIDGVLVSTNTIIEPAAATGGEKRNYLGRSNVKVVHPSDADFHGQMDEIRVWKVARSEAQIRETMSKKITGQEPELVGLWSFEDGTARDASPGAHHGKLMGQAIVTNAALPVIVSGKITDASGKLLVRASVHVRQLSGEERRFTANTAGEYAFTMNPSERCDVFVTNGELSAYRLGFQPTAEGTSRLDWTLADPEKTPVVLGSFARRAELHEAPSARRVELNETPSTNGAVEKLGPRVTRPSETQLSEQMGPRVTRPSGSGTAAMNFPAGTVVATVLTDEQGNFKFPNVKPGAYQVRAQIPGGRAWLDAGRILYVHPEASDAERARLANLDFRLAPFRKMQSRQYSVLQGLPDNIVFQVRFAADGAAWLGTGSGMARFDGSEFLRVSRQDGLPANLVYAIEQTPDGSMWIGTDGGLARYVPGTATAPGTVVAQDDFGRDAILEIRRAPNDVLWIRTRFDVRRYDLSSGQSVFKNPVVFEKPWTTETWFLQPRMAAAPDGRVWLTGPGAGLTRFEGTNVFQFTPQHGLLSTNTGGVMIAADGAVWFADGPSAITRFDGTNFVHYTERDGAASGVFFTLYAAPDTTIWVGAATPSATGWRTVLSHFDGKSFVHFRAAENVPQGLLLDIKTAPDGALWLASVVGLFRFEENIFTQITPADGLRPNSGGLISLVGERDGVWMEDAAYGLARYDGKRFQAFSDLRIRPEGSIFQIARAPDGLLWLASSNGILRFDGNQFVASITNIGPAKANSVMAVARAPDESMWVATEGSDQGQRGLARFVGEELRQWFTAKDGFGTNFMRPIHFMAKSTDSGTPGSSSGDSSLPYLVSIRSGPQTLSQYDGRQWTHLTKQDGVPRTFAAGRGWLETGPSGRLWFGSEGGLWRFNGQKFGNHSRPNA